MSSIHMRNDMACDQMLKSPKALDYHVDKENPYPSTQRWASPQDSDSSDEIVVFAGRKSGSRWQARENYDVAFASRDEALDIIPKPSIEDVMSADRSTDAVPLSNDKSPRMIRLTKSKKSKGKNLVHVTGQMHRGAHKDPFTARSGKDTPLADDVSDMEDNGHLDDVVAASKLCRRNIGDSRCVRHGDDLGRASGRKNGVHDWHSVKSDGFQDLQTPDDILSAKPRIENKRWRGCEDQIFTLAKTENANDVRWLPTNLHTAPKATRVRAASDEARATCLANMIDDSDESSCWEGKVSLDLEQEYQSLDHDWCLEVGKKAHMSDQQIAHMFDKQAQLGMSGDELLLFNGDRLASDSSEDHHDGQCDSSSVPNPIRSLVPREGKMMSRMANASTSIYTDSIDQDDYNGFDIMDRDRPSLQRKHKKGKHGAAFQLCDSELQGNIMTTWNNDRIKKKKRKQEREELRAQGLLVTRGKKETSANTKTSVGLVQLRDEIKGFLSSTAQQLNLPPMGHQERKFVHEAANKLNLRSKSQGHGLSRYPCLFKTGRTRTYQRYMLSAFDEIFASRKIISRPERNIRKTGLVIRKGRNGGTLAGTSYQDGEVVGTGAPELGEENRGRAILEKMGWSTGTALGACNNKGIIVPVTQVVKVSRAGLG